MSSTGLSRIVVLFVLSFIIFACARQDSADDGASVSVSLGSRSQHLAVHPNAADSGGKLPDTVDRVRIRVTAGDREIATGDLPTDGGDLKLKVPANLTLVVTGSALSGDEVLYEGDANVSPLRPGAAQHVALTLFPFGTLTTRVVRSTLEADVSENNELADGVVSAEIYSQIGFSADNHRLVFDSPAGNLSDGDADGHSDVFVKDLVTGKISNVHSDALGVLGDDDLLSADADAAVNQVVFASLAGNLVADDHNGLADVFLKDVTSGAVSRLSVRNDGSELNQSSDSPTIDDNGKTIAYVTDTDGDYVMLLQKNAGSYSRQSVGAGRLPRLSGDGNSLIYRSTSDDGLWLYDVAGGEKQRLLDYPAVDDAHHIDYDGNLIVFATDKSFTADDGNKQSDIYLLNRANQTVKWISTDRDGHGLSGGTGATSPSLDDAGRYVSFTYNATVYVKDADSGELGEVAQPGRDSYISPNGHLIAYHGDNGHVYVAPNPLFLQTPPSGEPTAPPETGLVGYALNVSHDGDGGGSVNSSDGGIQCGNLCSHTYPELSIVTLTATADASSTFNGWSGDCAGSGFSVQVTMNQVRNCSASFLAKNVTLKITLQSKTLQGDSINVYDVETLLTTCGGQNATSPVTCAQTVGRGQLLTLVATLGGNNNTITWTGCTAAVGTNGCDVQMDGNKQVTANVGAGSFDLTVAKATGGTVTDDTGQINCGNTCTGTYVNGTVVGLTATAAAGYRFNAWSGACSGNAPTAKVTMNAAKTCTPSYIKTFTLTLGVNPANVGTIYAAGSKTCSTGSCVFTYDSGTSMTLDRGTIDSNYVFSGWNNSYCGAAFVMDQNRSCSASYISDPLISNLKFADTELDNCVKNYATSQKWTRVSEFTTLQCAGYRGEFGIATIKSLAGIEVLTALQGVVMGTEDFGDLTPLAKLPKLTLLGLADTYPDFSTLPSFPALNSLLIRSGRIDSVAIGAIGKTTRLTQLTINFGGVADVTPLSNLTKLTSLDLQSNVLSSGVASLSTLTAATSILLNSNPSMPCGDVMSLDKAKDRSDGGFAGSVRWDTCYAAATVVSTNTALRIAQTFIADLDVAGGNGAAADADADLWFEAVTATEFYIAPWNGTVLQETGTQPLGQGGCYTRAISGQLSSTAIPLSSASIGKYYCLRTDLGHTAEFYVSNFQPAGAAGGSGLLTISFQTWSP